MKKVLAIIEETETQEMIILFERLKALDELYIGINNLEIHDKENLLDKMNFKHKETQCELKKWWDNISVKYQIDVENELYLEFNYNSVFCNL